MVDAVEAPGLSQPRKMSLLACMRCWPWTTRSPCDRRSLGLDERLEHRRLCLLCLQQQRVTVVAAEHQHDPCSGADAADAHHLPGDVGEVEGLEKVAAVTRQRPPVPVDELTEELVDLGPLDPVHELVEGSTRGGSLMMHRRPSMTRVSLSKACRLSRVRAFARFASACLRAAGSTRPSEGLERGLDVEVRVPDIEVRHHRELLHRRAIPRRRASSAPPPAPSSRTRCPGRRSRSWPPGA